MVNWHDPALLFKDYFALIKLNHALAGVFIWETVFTTGFELDALRGKRRYGWTIWLYLGTRYTGLLAFILFFLNKDGPRVPCKPMMIASFALPYACWAFASLIIAIRVIAIWNRNLIVSSIALGVWAGGLALNIRSLTQIDGIYNPLLETCIIEGTHRGLVNALGVLVVDVVLLVTMLIGLLRYANRSSTGIWKVLYQQCIIWIFLAGIAEVPVVVFLILNLNDAWNEMFTGAAITILSIGAARMYRSLSGCLTEFRVSPCLPRHLGDSTNPSSRSRVVNEPDSFQPSTRSERPQAMHGDQIQLEFAPSVSNSTLLHESPSTEAVSAGHEMV